MTTDEARALYRKFAPAVAYVAIIDKNGDEACGSAFHIGDGIFVTARHVVDVPTIKEVGTVVYHHIQLPDAGYTTKYIPGPLTLLAPPYFHPNSDIDVAILKADPVACEHIPYVELGGHFDDFLGDELLLDSVLVMGYPPIPMSKTLELFATRAEVNAIVDTYADKHPRFILSCMARGGFSGGLACNRGGSALGVVVESLLVNNQPTELGYLSVLTIEPIYDCLHHHNLTPAKMKESWIKDVGSYPWDKELDMSKFSTSENGDDMPF